LETVPESADQERKSARAAEGVGREEGLSISDGELERELRSWEGFADALRADDRLAFAWLLRSSYAYAPAMQARLAPFPVEALFMGLMLSQHKAILQLKREIAELREGCEIGRLDL